MPDREKVIGGLEQMLIHYNEMIKLDGDTKNHVLLYHKAMVEDALALLKEQEAVEPIPPEGDENPLYRCGNCNYQLFRVAHEKYCPNCGKPILWEGR